MPGKREERGKTIWLNLAKQNPNPTKLASKSEGEEEKRREKEREKVASPN